MHKARIEFRPDFFFGLCITFLLFPLKLTLSWICAALIHELGHYLVLRLTQTQIIKLSIGSGGVIMHTAPMPYGTELICALAGPIAGFLLLLFIRWMPILSVCALLQSIYNLIPIFPLDGGRAIKCLLKKSALSPKVYHWIETVVFFLLSIGALFLTFKLLLGPLPLLTVGILYVKVKLSCKQDPQAIQ